MVILFGGWKQGKEKWKNWQEKDRGRKKLRNASKLLVIFEAIISLKFFSRLSFEQNIQTDRQKNLVSD